MSAGPSPASSLVGDTGETIGDQTTDSPSVTIVTIVYNDLEGLQATAKTVTEQDYPNIEHLIVDGASTDGTADWLMSPDAQHPGRRIISEPDDGIYNAMNKGLNRATGHFIMFLNARDVFIRPDAITNLVAAADEQGKTWAFGYVDVVNVDNEVVRPLRMGEYTFDRQLWHKERLAHQAVLAPRERLIELGGFDETFKITADFDLSLRLAHKYPPAQLRQVIINYDDTGFSTQHWAQAIWEIRRARDKLFGTSPVGWVTRRLRVMTIIGHYWCRGKGKAIAKKILPEQLFKSVILRRS